MVEKVEFPYMTLEYVVKQSGVDIDAVQLDTSIDFDLMVPLCYSRYRRLCNSI